MIDRTKRYAGALLLGGLILAVATPAYVAHVAPYLAGALHHPVVLIAQAAPYVVCAALWLPWRDTRSATVALVFAALLAVAAVIIYAPRLVASGATAGDMTSLDYFGISMALTVAVLLGSAVVFVIFRSRPDQHADPGSGDA
jgi:hypothetical protein